MMKFIVPAIALYIGLETGWRLHQWHAKQRLNDGWVPFAKEDDHRLWWTKVGPTVHDAS